MEKSFVNFLEMKLTERYDYFPCKLLSLKEFVLFCLTNAEHVLFRLSFISDGTCWGN